MLLSTRRFVIGDCQEASDCLAHRDYRKPWTAQRNKKHAKADWQFTTADARVKLKRLYPSI